MTLAKREDSPKDGYEKVFEGLEDLQFKPDDLSGGADITIFDPLPVYGLKLDDIVGPSFLENAHLMGWRYLLKPYESISYADIKTANGPSEFVSITSDPPGTNLVKTTEKALSIASNDPSRCEARFLDIPALKLSGIWLTLDQPKFIKYIDGWQQPANEPSTLEGSNFIATVLQRADLIRADTQNADQNDSYDAEAQ